jgi:calcineurin-like phosphoesterase family protein
MGKVILEFDSAEEREEIQTALNGHKYKLVLGSLDQELRSLNKHAPDGTSEDTYKAYEHARDLLRGFLNDYNLTLD